MDVVIVGAGGHGRVVLEILRAAGHHRVLGFLDADESLVGRQVGGIPVLGHPGNLLKVRGKAKGAIVAVGDNRARQSYAKHLRDAGLELVTAVHPRSAVLGGARLGAGVVVAAGAVVATEAVVGESSIINTNAVVEHECVIGPAVHIGPGALLAGRVRVGALAFVGMGAKVIQCLTIGDGATVGAGAVVIRDVPAGVTVVGVPARVITTATAG